MANGSPSSGLDRLLSGRSSEFRWYIRRSHKLKVATKLSEMVTAALTLGTDPTLLVDLQPLLQWISPPVCEDAISETLLGERLTRFVLGIRSLACDPVFLIPPAHGSQLTDFNLLLSVLKDDYIHKLSIYSDYRRFRYTNDSINPLIHRQIFQTLLSLGVTVIQCIDHPLVEVYRFFEKGGVCGILSDNPDFALLSEIRFIDLLDFDLERALKRVIVHETEEKEAALIKVYEVHYFYTTLEVLLGQLNLSVEQLIDAALLSGNGYTSHLNSLYKMDSYINLKTSSRSKDRQFEDVCSFVRIADSSPLFELHEDLVHVMDTVPCYNAAVSRSVSLYVNTVGSSLPPPAGNSMLFWVVKMISLNKLSNVIHSLVHSGVYWKPPLFESIAVGRVSIHDLLQPVRLSLYRLLGLDSVTEYGSTSQRTFQETKVKVRTDENRRDPDDILQFILDLGDRPAVERVGVMFNLLINGALEVKRIQLSESLINLKEETLLHYSVVALSLYLYGRHVSQSPGEVDGLVEFSLAEALGFNGTLITERPNERALTISVWFSHTLDTLCHFCDILSLSGSLPDPLSLFKPLAAAPVIESHLNSHSPNFTNCSLNGSCSLSLLPSVKLLRSSCSTSSNGSLSSVSSPLYIVELFVQALNEVRESGLKSCCSLDRRRWREVQQTGDKNGVSKEALNSRTAPCSSDSRTAGPLSINEHQDRIISTIYSHTVTCIVGEAGCGKSSMVPQFIFDAVPSSNIIIAQPRCIATMGLAKRVSSQRGEACGGVVGYCVGGHKVVSKRTAITYCTAGYLLKKLSYHPLQIRKYSHIILDEVHERSIDADFILLLVRKLVKELSPSTKIVLMSATMQGPLFTNYFKEVFDKVSEPIFVGARCCKVEEYFVDQLPWLLETTPTSELSKEQVFCSRAIQLYCQDVNRLSLTRDTNPPVISPPMQMLCCELIVYCSVKGTAMLVFLPGINEILDYHEILTQELQKRNIEEEYNIYVLHSQVSIEEQYQILSPPPPNKTNVILSTNIAESSLTIPALRVIVNFGISKVPCYNHKQKMTCLVRSWCSKAACAQRSGRVGRVSEGIAIHLFPSSFYHHVLSDYNPAEMHTTPLGKLLLRARQLGEEIGVTRPSILLKQTIEPPSLLQIEYALQELVSIGAIVTDLNYELSEVADITILGQFSLSLPLDLELSRLVFLGLYFGCPVEAVVIATSISLSHDPFLMPSKVFIKSQDSFKEALAESTASRFKYDDDRYSDALMICSVFKEWCSYYYHKYSSKGWSYCKSMSHFSAKNSLSYYRFSLLLTLVSSTADKLLDSIPIGSDHYKSIDSVAKLTRDPPRDEISFCENDSIVLALVVASFIDSVLIGKRRIDSFLQQERKVARQARDLIDFSHMNQKASLVTMCSKNVSQNTLKSTVSSILPPPCSLEFMISSGMGVVQVKAPPPNMTIEQSLLFLWQFCERRHRWKTEEGSVPLSAPFSPFEVSWFRFNSSYDKVFTPVWRNRSSFVVNYSKSPPPFLGVATNITGGEVTGTCKGRGLTLLPSLRDSKMAAILLLAFQSFQSSIQLCTNGEEITAFKINSVELDFKEWQKILPQDLKIINKLRTELSILLSKTDPSLQLPLREMKQIQHLLSIIADIDSCPTLTEDTVIQSDCFTDDSNHQPFYPLLKCSLIDCCEPNKDNIIIVSRNIDDEEKEDVCKEKLGSCDKEGAVVRGGGRVQVHNGGMEVKERIDSNREIRKEKIDTKGENDKVTVQCKPKPPSIEGDRITANGGTTPLTANGGTTLVRANGGTTPLTANGGTTLVRANGGTTLVRANGGTPLVRANGGTTLLTANGETPLLTANGGAPLLTANEGTPLLTANGGTPLQTANGGAPLVRDCISADTVLTSKYQDTSSGSSKVESSFLNPQAVSFSPAMNVLPSHSLLLSISSNSHGPLLPPPPPPPGLPPGLRPLAPIHHFPLPPGFTPEDCVPKPLLLNYAPFKASESVSSLIEKQVLDILLRNGHRAIYYNDLLRDVSLSRLLQTLRMNLPLQFLVERSQLFRVVLVDKGFLVSAVVTS
ncbi:PREDICTED: uncharacterized protein LOC105313737 isoform X3 [Amphimedon queenslandica]|uniref:RNA helicase n=1 Tax=Amphimedon queenslandica TaxID=400682 RepID=A0AAN0JEE2_AMPQE|nr:PREDICTED: uncharacterized protein LOC105313737 isoform X3 [Amphimedon queenslandica]|eukprot:XP_019855390.1 PREDICTED: uncharacterized protein LOC105313737 isoform X3 [Amphimedon queenslandica]